MTNMEQASGNLSFFNFNFRSDIVIFDYSLRQRTKHLQVDNLNGMFITRNSLVWFNNV